ncbi:hypothetical protein IFM89_039408 [Coptis chinensis]|uniref:Uncharacterized protein n=1 Tax=Coptis chinensis TaxID=261450 RepID=A0A835MBT5_9MAGN|nr:hypothetical protein IFM89_039408 [Coptis chinensis]
MEPRGVGELHKSLLKLMEVWLSFSGVPIHLKTKEIVMSLAKACGRVLEVDDDSLNCCGKKNEESSLWLEWELPLSGTAVANQSTTDNMPDQHEGVSSSHSPTRTHSQDLSNHSQPPGFDVTLEVPPQNSNFEFEGNEHGQTVQTIPLVYDDGTEETVQVIHSTHEIREVVKAEEYVICIKGGSIESHTIFEEGTHVAQDVDHLHTSNGIIESGPSEPTQTQRHGGRKRFPLPSGGRSGAVGPWGPNALFGKFQQRMGLFTSYKTRGRHRSRSVGHRARSRSQISDPGPIIASPGNFSSNTEETNMNLSPTSLPTCEVGMIDTRVRANEVDMDSVGASKQGETTPHSAKDRVVVAGNLYRCRSEEEVRDWIQYMVIPLAGTLGISSSLGTTGLEKLFWELLATKSTNEDVLDHGNKVFASYL